MSRGSEWLLTTVEKTADHRNVFSFGERSFGVIYFYCMKDLFVSGHMCVHCPLCVHLQSDKRILCITLLLGFSGDDDHHVKAAATRALGCYIVYPCLREVDAGRCAVFTSSCVVVY